MSHKERALAYLAKCKNPRTAKQIAAKLGISVKSIYSVLHKAVADGDMQLVMKENTPYLFKNKGASNAKRRR